MRTIPVVSRKLGVAVITSSEVRNRPLHLITDRCIPMYAYQPVPTYTPHPSPRHPQPHPQLGWNFP